jgi:hypothetical protein
MIEAVGTSSTRAVSQRSYSQAATSVASQPEPVKAPTPAGAMLYVKVNNDMNRAILEARSSEGDVIRQYPSEYQIRAIQLASSLETKKPESAQAAQVETAEVAQEASPAPGASASPAQVSIEVADTGSVPAANTTQSVVV